jgi:uncharacterized membrane protein YfcA
MIPFDLSLAGLAWMAVAVLVAALVRGYCGFGYSAMVVAASGLVTSPLHFVAVVVILEMAMSLQAASGIVKDIDWQRVGYLMAGAVVGLPLGLWALTSVSDNTARAVISGYILLMCGILLIGWRMQGEVKGPANLIAGLVSGLANAPGMGGLPVAAYFAAQPMPTAIFRATMIAYAPLLDLYATPLFWWSGLISIDTFWAALMALPLTVLGNWLGSRHFLRTDPQSFRRFAICLLAALATLGLVKSVI